MNGKRKFDFAEIAFAMLVFVGVGVVFLLCFALGGCATTGGRKGDLIGTVERNSRDVGRLEAAIDAIDDAVERSRERFGEAVRASQGIEDSISRIDYLFERYERIAFGLLDEIDRIRNEAKAAGEDNSGVRRDAGGGCDNSDNFGDFGCKIPP